MYEIHNEIAEELGQRLAEAGEGAEFLPVFQSYHAELEQAEGLDGKKFQALEELAAVLGPVNLKTVARHFAKQTT